MRRAIDFLTTNLSTVPAIVAIVGQDCYLVAGPQDNSKNNFIVYTVSKRGTGTKDSRTYDVRVTVCNSTIAGLVANGDVVEQHLDTVNRMNFEGTSDIAYVQDQYYQIDYNYTLIT